MKLTLGAEPAAYSELIRQGILMAALFGWIHWTDQQVLGVLAFVSLALTVLTRQNVVPTATVEKAGTTATELKAAAAVNTMVEEKAVKAEEAKQVEVKRQADIVSLNDKEPK
jgi:hypothetical protein